MLRWYGSDLVFGGAWVFFYKFAVPVNDFTGAFGDGEARRRQASYFLALRILSDSQATP